MAAKRKKAKGRKGKKARKGRKGKGKRRSHVKKAKVVKMDSMFTRKVNKRRLPVKSRCIKNGPVDGKRVWVVAPLTPLQRQRWEEAHQRRNQRALEARARQASRLAASGRSGWEGIGAAAAARSAVMGYQD
jgi:hypothetical protein